jgi:hypothetical protein
VAIHEKTMEEIQGRNAVQMQDMPHEKGTWQDTLTCRPLCRACEVCYLEVVGVTGNKWRGESHYRGGTGADNQLDLVVIMRGPWLS